MDNLTEGSTVGRFVLTRLIGEGGMGMVWAARHSVTNKAVALKMLKPEQAADEQLRERFVREAKAACAVRHPNIVDIHDVIELEDGRAIMVMDLLEGESLGQKLDRERRIGIEEHARILRQVVSAVGTAHAAGVVHRDLKPDNIFLVKEPEGGTTVKVLDFGIAKVLATEDGEQTANLTGTGAMLGTPYYMSPEQIFGEKDIDHRADIWALGVIFYECLSGTRPTQAENVGQILKIIARHDIKPLEQVVPTLPKDLTDLVNRMLSTDREHRPRSLREVEAVLKRYSDVAVRSFAEPARVSRRSLPSPAANDSSDRVLVRSGQDVSALAATDVSGPPIVTSPDLQTFSPSSAAAKSSSQARAKPGRSAWLVAAAGAIVVAGVGLVAMRARDGVKPATPPPASAPTASFVPASATASAIAPVESTSAVASVFVAVKPTASVHATIKHNPTASASSPTPKSSALPGGVVEKPPF